MWWEGSTSVPPGGRVGWCIGTVSPWAGMGMYSSAEVTRRPERVICGRACRRSGFRGRKAGGRGKRLACWSVWRRWIPRRAEDGSVDGKRPEYGPVRIHRASGAEVRGDLLGVRPAQRQEGGPHPDALRWERDGGYRRVGRRLGRRLSARLPRVPHGRRRSPEYARTQGAT